MEASSLSTNKSEYYLLPKAVLSQAETIARLSTNKSEYYLLPLPIGNYLVELLSQYE